MDRSAVAHHDQLVIALAVEDEFTGRIERRRIGITDSHGFVLARYDVICVRIAGKHLSYINYVPGLPSDLHNRLICERRATRVRGGYEHVPRISSCQNQIVK